METKVQMTESRVASENKMWEKRYNRVDNKLKNILVWVLGMTVLGFALTFFMGTLIAWADPSGWPAYRVGLMFGGITGLVILLFGALASMVYLGEDM